MILENSQLKSRLLTYSPVGLAVLLMIPRLLTAEFGLFDDAETLRVADAIWGGDWEALSKEVTDGRMRPVYWIQYAFIYGIIGADPQWFFLWNTILFATLVCEVILLVRKMGGSRGQAWASGFLLALSGPIVENIYTLSKPELLQSTLMVAAILLFAAARQSVLTTKRLVIGVVVGSVLLLLATMTKETAVMMLPIAAGWLLLALIASPRAVRTDEARRWASLLIASLLATTVFLIARGAVLEVSLTGGAYSNNFEWSLSRFADSAIRWAGWMIRDFIWLAPLVILAGIDYFRRRLEQSRLILGASAWIVFWVLLYIPWEFTVEYYMLPVALGMSVIATAIAVPALGRLKQGKDRMLVMSLMALGAVLWLATFPNNVSNVRQQLTVDAANSRMLQALFEMVGDEGQVILNIQHENEYVYEIRTHVQDVAGMRDIQIDTFDPLHGLPSGSALIISPKIHNQPLLAVRMGVIESTQNGWNHSLQDELGEGILPDLQIEEGFRLTIIDLPRVLCPLLSSRGYCSVERPIFDNREFLYGWDIYHWMGSSNA